MRSTSLVAAILAASDAALGSVFKVRRGVAPAFSQVAVQRPPFLPKILRLGLDCMRRSMQKWRAALMSKWTLDVHPSQCEPSAFASRPSTIWVGKGFSWGASLAFPTDLLPDLASVSFISFSPCALPWPRLVACCFAVPSLSLTPDSARTPQAMASHTPLRPTPRHGWTPTRMAGKMHMPRPSPSSPR
jgi:hypothetical protein